MLSHDSGPNTGSGVDQNRKGMAVGHQTHDKQKSLVMKVVLRQVKACEVQLVYILVNWKLFYQGHFQNFFTPKYHFIDPSCSFT